jgi:hypothetical protein
VIFEQHQASKGSEEEFMLSKKITALAAGALMMASTAAVAQTAPSASMLSVAAAMQGAGEDMDDSGLSTGATIAGVFALIVVGVLIFGNDDNGEGDPISA